MDEKVTKKDFDFDGVEALTGRLHAGLLAGKFNGLGLLAIAQAIETMTASINTMTASVNKIIEIAEKENQK